MHQSAQSPTQKARQVLINHWDGELPIDPAALAGKLGIFVKPVTGCDYSGKAYQEEGSGIIEYNDSESKLRQRFTIAHELGHHVMSHTDATHQFRDDPSKFNLNVAIPAETQANKFAAELLMPKLAIEHFVFNEKISSLKTLAELFSVSTVAMQYRLKNLGLL